MRKPRLVYPGGLSAREQAIVNARRWQLANADANLPVPTEAYNVIVDLLATFSTSELHAAYEKGARV